MLNFFKGIETIKNVKGLIDANKKAGPLGVLLCYDEVRSKSFTFYIIIRLALLCKFVVREISVKSRSIR